MEKKIKIAFAVGSVVMAAASIVAVSALLPSDAYIPTATTSVPGVIIPSAPEKSALPDNWWETYEYVASPDGMTSLSSTFMKKSTSYIGWIRIPGTQVDDAIVLDPGENGHPPNWYYLDKYIDDTPSIAGSIFMDYRNSFGSVESEQSDHLIIRGHNMANNSMFGSLRKYRQNPKFYVDSPIIELSSNYEDYQYIIFGFLITRGYSTESEFRYTDPETGHTAIGFWEMVDLSSEGAFNYYVDTVNDMSMYETGVDVQYGDKLVTLSTCYKAQNNSRFLVVGRRLREHETSLDNIDRTEAYLEKKRQEEAAAADAERKSIAAETAQSQETTYKAE